MINENFLSENMSNIFINVKAEGHGFLVEEKDFKIYPFVDEREDASIYKKRGLLTIPEVDFVYKLNNFGFRTKKLKELDKNSYNILYAGCSFTFGSGLPEDLIWHGMLDKKIKNYFSDSKVIDSYNIGIRGADIISIIRNIYTFINLYGKPNLICLLVPEVTRAYIYNNEKYIKFLYRENILMLEEKDPAKIYMKPLVYENAFFVCSSALYALETFCNNLGIDLIWSSWIDKDIEVFNKLNFKNYIELTEKFRLGDYMNHPDETTRWNHELPQNVNNMPYWEHARDLDHPGTAFSTMVSNAYYEGWVSNVQKN